MNMKATKIIYWVSTSIVSLMMLFSVYMYFTSADMKAVFAHLGFPDFFRKELGAAKIIGVLLLLIPQVPAKFKEWGYAGFFIVFVSAMITHNAVGDEANAILMPLVFLIILLVSYISFGKLHGQQQAKA
jgi:DoxX-like family